MLKRIIFFSLLIIYCFTGRAQDPRLFKDYFANGKLQSVKHEGSFNGCNMPVGTDSLFYESGELMSTIAYDNRPGKTSEGCHDTWTVASTTIYFKNGRVKNTSQQKYSYEGTPCDCGIWQQKNTKGELIKNKNYPDCFDQIPCKNQ